MTEYYVPGAKVRNESGDLITVHYVGVEAEFVGGDGVAAVTYSSRSLYHPAIRALVGAVPEPAYDPATHHAPARGTAGWCEPAAKTADELAAEAAAARECHLAVLPAAVAVAVQERLDGWARQGGYDGIVSLCSYAVSTDAQFMADGQAGVAARDKAWRACYEILAAVERGAAAVPTVADVLAGLDLPAWPNASVHPVQEP